MFINTSGLLAGLDRAGPSAAHPLASPRAEEHQTIQCASALPRNTNAGPRSAAAVGSSSIDNGTNLHDSKSRNFNGFKKEILFKPIWDGQYKFVLTSD